MTWDGKERRDDPNGEGLPAREVRRRRRSYRFNKVIDQMFERRYVIAAVVFMEFMLLGVGFFGIVNTNDKAADGIGETRRIVDFISQYVETSAERSATRNNNLALGLDCHTQLLAQPAEARTPAMVDDCRAFFKAAVVPTPTRDQIEEVLRRLGK